MSVLVPFLFGVGDKWEFRRTEKGNVSGEEDPICDQKCNTHKTSFGHFPRLFKPAGLLICSAEWAPTHTIKQWSPKFWWLWSLSIYSVLTLIPNSSQRIFLVYFEDGYTWSSLVNLVTERNLINFFLHRCSLVLWRYSYILYLISA